MLNPVTCAARLNVLLELSRSVDEPVPTAADVARVLSIRTSEIVTPDRIESALRGLGVLDSDLLNEIAAAYAAPPELFSDSREGAELENKLRVCIAIRDRYNDDGVNVIARGSRFSDRQVTEMLGFLHRT